MIEDGPPDAGPAASPVATHGRAAAGPTPEGAPSAAAGPAAAEAARTAGAATTTAAVAAEAAAAKGTATAIEGRAARELAITVGVVLAPQFATNATARRRFVREAKAIAAVSHEHVVAVHAVSGDDDPHPYIVMQLVQGASLQDRLDRTGPLVLKEILRIGLQTASGLAAAHAQGLVHRDIKPANILLESSTGR